LTQEGDSKMIGKRIWGSHLVLVLAVLGGFAMEAVAQDAHSKPTGPTVPLITTEELKARFDSKQKVTIIDVRGAESYANSDKRIKGAIYVKLRRLKYRLSFAPLKDVPRDQEVVTYCACQGETSAIAAAQVLMASGFKNVRALKGGWTEWLKISGPVEARPKG
jgi:rhodanese-related sulfurtransferase